MLKEIKRIKSSLLLGGGIFSILLFSISLIIIAIIKRLDGGVVFDERIYDLLKFSLYQAFLSTILSLFIGLILAWSLAHNRKFFGRDFIVALFASSLVLPSLLVAFGIIGIYGESGVIKELGFDIGSIYGLKGILLAHIYLNASYATKALLNSFESISSNRYKLSKSLGLGVLGEFWYVEFVAIKRTLFSIGATIFLLCFSSFAIVLLLGGSPAFSTLEVAIYEAVRVEFDIPKALGFAFVQLLVASFVVLLSISQKSSISTLEVSKNYIEFKQPLFLKLIQYLIIALFLIFYILPLLVIISDGVGADFGAIFSDELFVRSLKTSLILSFVSGILSVVVAFVLSDLKRDFEIYYRLGKYGFSRYIYLFITFFSNIYLAISSLILGLGFFLVAIWFDLDQSSFAWIVLIFSNVLLSLPFALSTLYPMMQKSAKRYDRLIFSLGIDGVSRFRYIELPYIRGALIYIFSLSFCFSMGDLGIIALFGSEDFTTLPWYLYSLLGNYQSQSAYGVGLIMLVISLGVFMIGERFAKNR